jgi:hypothetical protein
MLVIIQIAIAVVVVYLVFSIMVYVITEWIASLLQLRGKTLAKAIVNLFDASSYPDLGRKLLFHPQIDSLKKGKKFPSYIPAANVARAVIDLVKDRAPGGDMKNVSSVNAVTDGQASTYQLFKNGLNQLDQRALKVGAGDPTTKSFLSSLADQTNDLASLTAAIEKWYNDYMDRVSGWYKRNVRIIVFIVGAMVTVGFNVDTLHIVNVVATDPVTRDRLNKLGDRLLKDSLINHVVLQQRNDQDYYDEYVNDSSFDGKNIPDQIAYRDSLVTAGINQDQEELKRLNQIVYEEDLPVGWNIKKKHKPVWTIVGWIITALALSAGAPFWFDMLKQLVNLRNTGSKPDGAK